MASLEKYYDQDVDEVVVAIRKAGDSLSKPLHFEPILHEPGTASTIALQLILESVTYKFKPETGTYRRIENFVTVDGGFIPNGQVEALLNEQAERIRTAEQRAKDSGADPFDLFGKTSDVPTDEEEQLAAEEAAADAVVIPPPMGLPAAGESTDTTWETPPPPTRGVDSSDDDVRPKRTSRKRAPRKTTTKP